MTTANASMQGRAATADPGADLTPEERTAARAAQEVFSKLTRGIKQILLYRHNKERYGEYMLDTLTALQGWCKAYGALNVRVGPTSYEFKGITVYEDDSRENNLCYPFYAHGVRLLIFNQGLTMEEFLRFLELTFSASDAGARRSEDFVTRLWKAQLQSIQYVVVEGFKVVEDEDVEQVQLEVDKVVAYLYRQLQSNTDDVARFARVDVADLELKLTNVDQIRSALVSGITASAADKERLGKALQDEEQHRILPKMVIILFQLLELATDDKNYEDVAEAFVQLLDAMLLAERYDVIGQILDRFAQTLKKPLKPNVMPLVKSCQERFLLRMGEQQRLLQISHLFNAGPLKDPVNVLKYLRTLNQEALPPLLDALERIEIAANRRFLADAVVDMARPRVDLVAHRLHHPSSNVVKDMLYILDRIDPPNKLDLMAMLLEHQNLVLRLETVHTLGRNPSDRTLPYIIKCIKGPDAQLRTAAARVIQNFEPDRAATELLHQVSLPDFPKREKNEQRAFLASIAQVDHPRCQQFIQNIMGQKGNLLTRNRVDEAKLQLMDAMTVAVGVPVLQMLAAWAQDPNQSKEVQTAARQAALDMRNKLVGAGRQVPG